MAMQLPDDIVALITPPTSTAPVDRHFLSIVVNVQFDSPLFLRDEQLT